MKFGSVINYNFLWSNEGHGLLSTLLKRSGRKQFGVLESPAVLSNIYDGEVSYKVFLCGRSGIGKTSIVSKLTGKDTQDAISETCGIQVSVVYWPVQIIETKKVVLFKVSFWDTGEHMLNMYNHILPSCLEDIDGILYTFSLADKSSWDDLSKLITRIDAEEEILKVCVGTRLDLSSKRVVTSKMIEDFMHVWRYPVLKINNTRPANISNHVDSLKETAPFLNRLCELLWYRDQVKAGLVQNTLADFCFTDENMYLHERSGSTGSRESVGSKGSQKVTFC